MVGIVTIAYNEPRLIVKQLELIERFCQDEHEICVVDNSTNPQARSAIEYHAHFYGAQYIGTSANAVNSSVSAVFALNLSYTKLHDKYDYFLYLDHDAFPLHDFSVIDELGDKLMAGVGQQKGKMYLHPGYLMFNNREMPPGMIDFSCNSEFGLDTGGNLYRIIEKYPDAIKYWDETYEENPYFTEGFYNFFAMINRGMFMHFINGSNWNHKELSGAQHEMRLNALLAVLNDKTK